MGHFSAQTSMAAESGSSERNCSINHSHRAAFAALQPLSPEGGGRGRRGGGRERSRLPLGRGCPHFQGPPSGHSWAGLTADECIRLGVTVKWDGFIHHSWAISSGLGDRRAGARTHTHVVMEPAGTFSLSLGWSSGLEENAPVLLSPIGGGGEINLGNIHMTQCPKTES